ncbi:MAG: DNA replication and repair protein RecF [Arachidicoccus sp.]|nr:DNA replication and repair protein RecF [Arachidicoccus sp.]
MPFVKKISLVHFRNYLSASFDFTDRIIGICGANGSGKTNLLDAVYYLCFTKSYFSKPEIKNTYYGENGFAIRGIVSENPKDSEVSCVFRENGRKEFYTDGEQIKKFSKHIGRFPAVMIAPDDAIIITGGSEERRKFLDTVLSQLYPAYLQSLINYNRILLQRNSCLKNIAETQSGNYDLLDIFDKQLAEYGESIFVKRKEFTEKIIPLVIQQYNEIAEKNEAIQILYSSALLQENSLMLLKENRQKDLLLQRTTDGIHKDDLHFYLDNESFKQVASQGQRKSMLFALKLAEYYFIREIKKQFPILLLDDVFEKLDQQRMLNLLRKVCIGSDSQIFITDTHKHRLDEAFKELDLQYQMIGL